MTSGRQTLPLITSVFPGRDFLIDRAYREDPSFRDLCRDYRKCAEALEAWRRSIDDPASLRAREYAELLNQLRSEISSWLEAMESGSATVGRDGSR